MKAPTLPGQHEEYLRYLRDMAVALRDRPEPGMLNPQWVIDGITFQLGEDVAGWRPVTVDYPGVASERQRADNQAEGPREAATSGGVDGPTKEARHG